MTPSLPRSVSPVDITYHLYHVLVDGQGGGLGVKAVMEGAISPKTGKKVMLVFFIGGVTFMEIAALRFLSRQANFPYSIIICTTKLVNGNTFIKSIIPDMQRLTLSQTPSRKPPGPQARGSRGGRN